MEQYPFVGACRRLGCCLVEWRRHESTAAQIIYWRPRINWPLASASAGFFLCEILIQSAKGLLPVCLQVFDGGCKTGHFFIAAAHGGAGVYQ